MSTILRFYKHFKETKNVLSIEWQELNRQILSALTCFTPNNKSEDRISESTDLVMRNSGWSMLPAEVFDDSNKVVVRVEAPGMEKDNFDLQIFNNCLLIRGEKYAEREFTEGYYHLTQCAYGRFEHAVPIPDEVDATTSSVTYNNGILRVELKKSIPRPSNKYPGQVVLINAYRNITISKSQRPCSKTRKR